jgi:nucleoside-diphosphate-sugar epimerase
MKKILVTGATGFIGHYVIAQLLQHNCRVVATSSNEAKATTHDWYRSVQYIPFNLEQFDTATNYFRFFDAPDAIIHLAWEGLPNYNASFHTDINLPRHKAFLHNLVMHGMKDVTVTGTCFEYGMTEGSLQENMPARPANPYATAKNDLRLYLEQLQQQYSFVLKWARLFYMYGKGQNPKSLFSQLDEALARGEAVFNMSGGEQVRDFLPVQTMAAYIVKIALQQQVTGIINVGSGEPLTVKQIVNNYLTEKNKTIQLNLGYYPYPDYEPMRFWGDVSKLKTILNDN